jgi:hypothetical protein
MRGRGVLRDQLQRREVQQDEVAGAALVQAVYYVVHAVDIIAERLACDLAVGEEGVVSDVVCADPDGVDGGGGGAGEEGGAVGGDVFGVGEVGGELVVEDVRERCVDAGEPARGYGIGADCAANGVVVQGAVGVDGGVTRPDEAAGGGFVALWAVLVDFREH